MTTIPLGRWPSEDEALAMLLSTDTWKRVDDGMWEYTGHLVTHHNAILIAQIRRALGQESLLTDVVTSDLLAALVKRVLNIERATGLVLFDTSKETG
jgi:hypothetical protein